MSASMMASRHRWIYVGAIVVLAAMLVVGLLSFSSVHRTNAAAKKAQQLNQQLTAHGYPTVSQSQIARTLGTDGGPVCTDPDGALEHALWLINQSNGADGPGQRPVISDRGVLDAGALVVQVYCPEQAQTYQDKINDLKTGKTVQ